nr:hypothetical transcript [Hymenolepis microstoma]
MVGTDNVANREEPYLIAIQENFLTKSITQMKSGISFYWGGRHKAFPNKDDEPALRENLNKVLQKQKEYSYLIDHIKASLITLNRLLKKRKHSEKTPTNLQKDVRISVKRSRDFGKDIINYEISKRA